MARYALVLDGQVAEYREADKGSPAHKVAADGGPLLRLVIDPGEPAYNSDLETLTRSTDITPDAVRVVYTVTRRDLDAQKQAVKRECERRIIAMTGATDVISCIIKQANANMRANELNDKRLAGESLSAEEMSEAQALRNLAEAIKALRAKSNDIEALSPIPLDYTDDQVWSA